MSRQGEKPPRVSPRTPQVSKPPRGPRTPPQVSRPARVTPSSPKVAKPARPTPGSPAGELATFAVGRRGIEIAERIAQAMGGDLLVPIRWQGLTDRDAEAILEGTFGERVRTAFSKYEKLVLVVPVGIA